MPALFLGCDQIKQLVTAGRVDAVHARTDGTRALNVSFMLAVEAAELAACIVEKINYLTDGGRIGYEEWVQDASVLINRA